MPASTKHHPVDTKPPTDSGAPYKLTQAECRRLNDQVRETSTVPVQLGRVQRGSGFKDASLLHGPTSPAAATKVDMFMTYEGTAVPSMPSRQDTYVIGTSSGVRDQALCDTNAIPNPFPPQRFVTNVQGQSAPIVHRSQLASNFRAFQDKRWRPYVRGVWEGGGEGGSSTRASSRLSSRPSSSTSIWSDQRLLDKRSPSALGHRSSASGRPHTRVHTPGVTYPHPAHCYRSHQHDADDSASHHHIPTSQQSHPQHGSQQELTANKILDATISKNNVSGLTSYGSQAYTGNLSRQSSVPNLAPLSQNRKSSITPPPTQISAKSNEQLSLAYDTLTPEIIYQLSSGPRPFSVYGSRPGCYLLDGSTAYDTERSRTLSSRSEPTPEDNHRTETSPTSAKRDTDSTSGIGTDKESDDDSDEDDDSDDDHDSNDSDDDRIPEPKLEDIKMADLPKLILRPEQLDAMYIPDQPHDRRRFDFDPMKCEVIPFEFADALSPHLMALDLHQVSITDRRWQTFAKAPAADSTEEKIIDRLLELERLQHKTKELELIRRDRLRSAHVRARSRVGMTIRQKSAKVGERKCCADCLQVACVGDCPSKRNHHGIQLLDSSNCLICAEKDCNGHCCQSAYDARSRQNRPVEDEPRKTTKFRPRSCTSCTMKNPAKIANAANVIMGRPKSSYSTFSSVHTSTRPPRDIRPKGGHVASQLEEEFERLGINPEPDHQGASGMARRKLKGRAGQFPGKSFFSQRRHSLTDIAKEIRVKSANKKRLKSAKKKSSSKTDTEG